MAVEALGVASSVIAIVDMSFKIIHIVGRYMSGVKDAKDDMRNLIAELTECHTAADEMDKLLKDPKAQSLLSSRELASTLDPARVTLKDLKTKLEASSNSSLGSLKWPQLKDSVEETVKRLARTRERMLFLMNVDQTRQGQNIEHRIVIDKLLVAEGAAFDSHAQEHSTACLPDTRVELLQEVAQWIESPDSRAIFWLNGMAGTGKSTISQSVALLQSAAGQLGATFFFKKGEADRSSLTRFMSTLARQLADSIPGVGPLIKAAVEEDPGISGKLIQQQFDRLIREPLATYLSNASAPARVVFVIDALDECEKDANIRLLIQVITSATSLRSHLRFFLTSRPNLPVRLGFKKAKDTYQDLVLHEIPDSIVGHDLAVFFRVNFDLIRSDFNAIVDTDSDKLLDNWPGDDSLHELVSRSNPLFIFAATVCRFVSDPNCGNPKTLLARFLASKSSGSHLSQTYSPILESQLVNVPIHLRAGIIKDFILVVGSIVILAEPLGRSSLAFLLGEARDTVNDRLRLLHSVLKVPTDDSPVRLLHLSFGDYLLDRGPQMEEAHRFYVDKDFAHRTVAERSIRLMREWPLRQNIADLRFPGIRASYVEPQHIADSIPPPVGYACRHWIHHWTSSQFDEHYGALVHDFLKVHLLHWWEALSLLGFLKEATNALRSLLSWIEPSHSLSALSDFVADAIRFLRSNFDVINSSPLQLYSSVLALSPEDSVIKRSFASCITSWPALESPVSNTWAACLAVLDGVCGVSTAFSHDSKRLVVGTSYSHASVWDMETGRYAAILSLEEREHESSGSLDAVAFSHDSKMVAASCGCSVYVWMVDTKKRLLRIDGYREKYSKDRRLLNMYFTPDSKSLLSDSADGVIHHWDLTSGACTTVLEPLHETKYRLVNYHFHNLSPIVLAYDGSTGQLWDFTQTVATQTVTTTRGPGVRLEGPTGSVEFAASSHNHGRIAIASGSMIRCWNVVSGELLNTVSVHRTDFVSLTFCGDSQSSIIAATGDGSIHFWNVDKGEISEKLLMKTAIGQLACSPDGSRLSTCDIDVMIWDINGIKRQDVFACTHHLQIPSSLVLLHNPGPHPLPQILGNGSPLLREQDPLWNCLGESQGRNYMPGEARALTAKFPTTTNTLAIAACGDGPFCVVLFNSISHEIGVSMSFHSDDSTMLAAFISSNSRGGRIMVWNTILGSSLMDFQWQGDHIAAMLLLPEGKKRILAPQHDIFPGTLRRATIHFSSRSPH